MDDALATTFSDASHFLIEAVLLIPDADWDQPGLGSWTLRELVGHANRSHTLVEEYLLTPREPEPPGSLYFSEEAIGARGREAVVALGTDPVSAVNKASESTISLIETTAPDAVIGSPSGTMSLREYLPSRIAELTIHGLDIVRAVSAQLTPPATALEGTLTFVARRSTAKAGVDILFALTGRGSLPVGYSVY